MRILVTGGAGYIGSATVRELLDSGHEVVVLDSLERGYSASVAERAEFVRGDVGDTECVRVVLDSGVDAVMHLAGMIEVAESQTDPARYFEYNLVRPIRMLDTMVSAGVKHIAFSSTAAVYGEPRKTPISEDDPTEPVNAYGRSKLMFEQVLDAYGLAYGLESVRLRYFNVAGAWPDGSLGEAHDPETHIIPRVLRAMSGGQAEFQVYGDDYPTRDGTCVRDYIHVADLARAHRLALERLHAGDGGGVFNLGTGDGFTNLEVVRTCAEVTGTDVEVRIGPRRPGDPAVLIASNLRAGEILGWQPERSELRTMAEDAWRWHSAHPKGYEAR